MCTALRWAAPLLLASAAAAQTVFEPDLERGTPGAFRAQAGGVTLWSTESGVVLALVRSDREAAAIELDLGTRPAIGESEICRAIHRFRGAERRASDRVHERLRQRDAAPGCDVVWRDAGGGFEYDLELAARARWELLEVRVRGHEGLWIAPDGSLVIETAAGALVQPLPRAWTGGELAREVECRFRLLSEASFGFEIALAPSAGAAVIDPALRWSSYLSGGSDQSLHAVGVLPGGATVVAGETLSLDFPTTLGAFDPLYHGGTDACVSCFSPDGTQLLWSTFLGGAGDEGVRSLAIGSSGAITLAGETTSSDFPTTPGGFDSSFNGVRDVFVAQLDPSGSALLGATFLGGSSTDRFGQGTLAPGGDFVLVGTTRGAGFPVTAGAFDTSHNGGAFFGDVFVARVAADASNVVWSTFFGSSGEETGERLAIFPNGDVAIAGTAYSPGFPVTAGAFDTSFQAPSDAFVARFAASGAQLSFATFLGGSGEESVRALAVEPSGTLLAAGECKSADFPVTPGVPDPTFEGASDGFLARLAANGAQLLHSTFVGGADEDRCAGLAVDAQGDVVLVSESRSLDLLTSAGCFRARSNQPIGGGPTTDLYVQRYSQTLASAKYATYFGSPGDETLGALVLDAGELVLCGTTRGPGLPVSNGAFQPLWNFTALHDGFASRLAFLVHPIAYGLGKLNSGGTRASMRWDGFPSATDNDFRVGLEGAMPNEWSQVFRGVQPAHWPFAGGYLRVATPFHRYPRVKTDFLGYAIRSIAIEPWMVGQTLYFQVWYEDDGDPWGVGLSDALRVIVYP
jgi:hypothetical protein